MPSTLYTTKCYIKNDSYQLSIRVNDNNDQNSINNQLTINESEFKPTKISLDTIIPSSTQLCFEAPNTKKNTNNAPKEIILNYLLSVQQTTTGSNRRRRNFNYSPETTNIDTPIPSANEPSRDASCATLNTIVSEVTVDSTPKISHSSSFGRFFSTQSQYDCKVDSIRKTVLTISYIDVSNFIRWNIKRLDVEVDTEDTANELYINLNLCLSMLTQRPRNLLAFVNPFGGKGRARAIFERTVLPIFNEANVTVKPMFTERAHQAQEYIMHEDLTEYDGIVCVGGDGMFAELSHGLLLRTCLEANLNIDDPEVKIIRPNLRIGIIPAGSTDAVVFGTTGLNDPKTSALQIIVGETLSIDIAAVHNEKGFVSFMAVMLAYGFFGDIIQQSEKWRFLGPFRYDLSGFYQFIRNRSYYSELKVQLSDSNSSPTGIRQNHSDTESESPVVADAHHLLHNSQTKLPEVNQKDKVKPLKVLEKKLAEAKQKFCRRDCETCAVREDHESATFDSPSTIKLEGRYTTINCLNMPGRCAKSKFGMSPYVHLGDGTFDLILVKRSWRTGFLRFLWQVANDGRLVSDLPNVEHYCVREVVICPKRKNGRSLGNWACDGELISANEVRIRSHRQALSLFASGIQYEKVEESIPIKKQRKSRCCPCFPIRRRKHQEESV